MFSKLSQLRYFYESEVLVHVLYNNTAGLIHSLINDKSILYKNIDKLYRSTGEKIPYTLDEYSIGIIKIIDDLYMLKITFPKPEVQPLCYCAYVFFGYNFKLLSFFYVERATMMEGNEVCLCTWTQSKEHINYGMYSIINVEEIIERCVDITIEKL